MPTNLLPFRAALLLLLAVPFATTLSAREIARDFPGDRAALLDGVHGIVAPGLPGSVLVFGPDAFAVVAGRVGKDVREPVVAAARLGKGRIVAFGHDGYLREGAKDESTGRLLVNALRWAAGGNATAPTVAVRGDFPETRDMLRRAGLIVVAPDARADVIVGDLSEVSDSERKRVERFIRDGGGLVVAETGWGWKQVHDDAPMEGNGGNRIVRAAGLFFSDGTLERTTKTGFATDALPSDEALALNAATALGKVTSGGATAQSVWTLSRAVSNLPDDDRVLRPRLERLLANSHPDYSDIERHPVSLAAPLDRLAMTIQVRREMTLPADRVTAADPSAASFPGAVPASAPRIATVNVSVDTRVPEWHSTGLYAAPGERITVTLPQNAAGKGLTVRIGAHRDALWNLPSWKRAPEITRTFPLARTVTVAANAFGGPVYLVVPENPRGLPETVTVAIGGGAVAAPYFVKNRTSLAEWKNTLRNAPAPWAELQGDNCILTVPSADVRHLDDPQALMTYWDDVMDRAADLYARPRARRRQERYCTDRQISAGYMHSGYPIMTWLDVAPRFTDLAVLRGNDGNRTWGFYHELGHNHQQSDWTWDGCGEVTNNLFSLYGGEVFNDAYAGGDYFHAHGAVAPEKRQAGLRQYLAAGAPYEKWKSDPFLALTLFIQLRRRFGWEPFPLVFAQYRTLGQDARPKTDEEKRDQFMVRFSRAVGYNLGPFFQAWDVPTSESARKSIAGLPPWMPADWPR